MEPSTSALCVCYELGEWRAAQFIDHIFEWLPEFALTWSERQRFADITAVRLLREAARVVYATERYGRRGEFGELLLHIAMRQVFDTEPAISKLFYKDAVNDTVKGFDAVHVVPRDDALELWLGEAKFYEDPASAVKAAAGSIADHTDTDYLRGEFAAIINKIDDAWNYADQLKRLLDPNTSLDEIFSRAVIAALITYDSATVSAHTVHDAIYEEAFRTEVTALQQALRAEGLPTAVTTHLFLVPLLSKRELAHAFDERLKAWQSL